MPNYDVAVVGAGLAGLATAALLAKKGKAVVVLEPSDEVGGSLAVAQKQGFLCSTGPSLSFGFERDGVLSRLYAELGITQSASLRSPSYQVVLPDRRINIFSETVETLDELRREFPREIDAISGFFRDIEKTAAQALKSTFSAYRTRRRKAGNFVARYGFSGQFLSFLNVQSLAFFGCPVADLSLASLVMLTTSAPLSLHGGFRRLSEQLRDAFLMSGGTVQYHMPWPRITFDRKHISGLATPDGNIQAQALVYNVERQEPAALLFMGLRDEVVPLGMHLDLICLPDYGKPDAYFTISLSAPDDEKRAPKGMRALCAADPAGAVSRGTRGGLVSSVGSLIPYLDRYTVFADLHAPRQRRCEFPEGVQFRPVTAEVGRPALERGPENLYLLHDGTGSAVPALGSAWKLVERLSWRPMHDATLLRFLRRNAR